MKMRQRSPAAFTLFEMMIVTAIAGILTAMTVVGLRETMAATAKDRAARNVAQLMKRARSHAVVAHQRVALRANTTTHTLELFSCDQRYGAKTCVGATPVFTAVPTSRVNFNDTFQGVKADLPTADGDGNLILFNADGFPAITTNQTWRFGHSANAGSREIVVSISGDVRLGASATLVVTSEI
ncbi:MAG: GspH/FimT family protein [Deltaproteobacteria bacterium]|nr:GspH/FimT family protein [Deltaproteobacteria bacterium]